MGHGGADSVLLAATVPALDDVVDLCVGWNHNCAVLAGGGVECWGDNADGQIGNDDIADAVEPSPVAGIDNAVRVGCGSSHSCALLDDGSVRCWGSNSVEQLGVSGIAQSRTPVDVTVL
jgi:alpha-tubulin suppressor-like RCC1 family protein